ncbi:hypothetical protein TNCT_686121 [Trichonephila clavata]|uniref:Uncharacterized protein n=1 Tax=Trichonephila clavata TaxID=2740835 RepID=A0A8X6KGL6_TRICU|nr:hypothetical protein TNCT_686121 [Trichonephila clavata]
MNCDFRVTLCYKKGKKLCYSKLEAFRVTSTCSDVRLQDILDHTCFRLCQYLYKVLEGYNVEEQSNLEMIGKWDCDV